MRGLFAAALGALALSPVSLVLGGAACEITLPGDDAGGAGGGGDAAAAQNQTVGDQCSTIFTELCTQAISRCGLGGFTLDQCINANLPTCCTGSACNDKSQFSASDVAACTGAIDSEDCNAVATNTTPSACTGFLTDQ